MVTGAEWSSTINRRFLDVVVVTWSTINRSNINDKKTTVNQHRYNVSIVRPSVYHSISMLLQHWHFNPDHIRRFGWKINIDSMSSCYLGCLCGGGREHFSCKKGGPGKKQFGNHWLRVFYCHCAVSCKVKVGSWATRCKSKEGKTIYNEGGK